VVFGVWALAVGAGLCALGAYAATAGMPAEPPASWPAHARLELSPDAHTLVMVAHPRCSCTRASIAELARLMTRLSGTTRGYALFVRPEGMPSGWERTDLWQSAAHIPGITVVADPVGEIAARFGAATSGTTLLYSPDGRLLFRGGITPSRSHQGNSVGRRRIIELVAEARTDRGISDVFGCALSDG
jgi:hypothetical protein